MSRLSHMRLHGFSRALVVIFSVGLLVAYGAAGAGLLKILNVSHVSLLALVGACISFVGMVGYFLVGSAEIEARLARFDDLNNSTRATGEN
jgi:hypothetical protein